ncbi:MAG: hypothetical protein IPI01_16175 [Ignavibacteriae bacterium]|nr:hypothetical protein [Ignavibacteriota bacterium]
MTFAIISILVAVAVKGLIARDARRRFGSWGTAAQVIITAVRSAFTAGDAVGKGWWPRTIAGARQAAYLSSAVLACILAITGFIPAVFTASSPSGTLLLIHMIAAPLFALTLAAASLLWSHDQQVREEDLPLLAQVVRTGTLYGAVTLSAVARALYWLILVLTLPLLLSIILSLFPLFGTEGEHCLIGLHGYSALALMVLALLHGYIRILLTLSGTHQG